MLTLSKLSLRDSEVLAKFRTHVDKPALVLESEYPHVMTRLLLVWGGDKQELKEFWNYHRSLVVSDRPDRQGFSHDALREILAIGRLHEQEFGKEPNRDVWSMR